MTEKKIFLSADIEGTAGIAAWEETEAGNRQYDAFAARMTGEVNAACEGAVAAGANDILIKDAHDSARNLNAEALPECARVLRGWIGAPCSMMGGLDETFSAVGMTGYHTGCATNGSPLAHTMNLGNEAVYLNGHLATEFEINALYAASMSIPVVFISGDEMICETARRLCPSITAVPVSQGVGGAVIGMHPARARQAIREGMEKALSGDLSLCRLALPQHFDVEIRYREAKRALQASFYPGAEATGMKSVAYHTENYTEVLRFLFFTL
jgi:D-amino peptidase